jgi:FkbM family methyltransferase
MPLRVIEMMPDGRKPYRLALHPPDKDIYLSDVLWTSYLSVNPVDPFSDLHLRFQAAADLAGQRYGGILSVPAIDVGAHCGIHSAFLASLGFHVTALDPNPDSFQLLRCNSALHSGPGRINAEMVAGGPEGFLSTPFPDNIGHSFTMPFPTNDSLEIRTIPLLTLFSSLPSRPWLLKLSTEGTEATILAPLLKERESRPRYIWTSIPPGKDGWGTEPIVLLRGLLDSGYRVFVPRSSRDWDKRRTKDGKMGLEKWGIFKGDLEVKVGRMDLEVGLKTAGALWAVHGSEFVL